MAYGLLLLFVLLGQGLAFQSTPGFTSGKSHTSITEEAVLREAVESCKAVALAEGKAFTPPVDLTAEKVLGACMKALEDRMDVSAVKFRELLDEIITANTEVDDNFYSSAPHHFHNEAFIQGRDLITKEVISIKASLQKNEMKMARRTLGAVSHILQDFYSHSDWIELGNTKPYASLLRADLPLENIADVGTPTCTKCREPDCKDLILPNILKTHTLTSGYNPAIGSSIPRDKCFHGDSFGPGINKDDPATSLAPGEPDPHDLAAKLATEATVDLLRNIRNTAGDLRFLKMLGISRSSVLCFVIDTTKSMTDDIAEVRRLTSKTIDDRRGTSDEPSLYILALFNDPDVGPVKSTTDADEFKKMIAAVAVYGDKNFDLPEKSLSGLQLALTTAPPSSEIFLFTDAPAKDTELEGAVRSLISSTKSRVSFLLTNILSRRKRRSVVSNRDNILYEKLAKLSGGLAIEVSKSTLPLATTVIMDTVSSSLVNLFQVSVDPGRDKTFSFLVDPSVHNVSIYIIGFSASFTLKSPTGVSQESRVKSGPLGKISAVGNLHIAHLTQQTGTWQISIRSTRPYNIRVIGHSVLDFLYKFIRYFKGLHPGFVEIEGRPSAELSVVDATGSSTLRPSMRELDRGTFFAFFPTLPDGPFTLQLRGKSDGHSFQRESTNQIQASQISIQVQRILILHPGVPLSVPFKVTASGNVGKVKIQVRATQNFVASFTPSSVTLAAGGSATSTLNLLAPPSTPSGSACTITIVAESTGTGQSNYAIVHTTVMSMITDLKPPTCVELHRSPKCPIWEISLAMSDGDGTGIEKIFHRGADGNITSTVTDTQTLVTFSASCCEESVEFVAVDRVGNAGTCSFAISTPPKST
ncbi:von Willebrand factor A domain-containing protein 7-like [Chanos chanos]|uniref:von Willebrand factor A domain-containing protein 7-like n=1 Tax=Chanos chanos TaxID=29144 RepID=A0A6J2W841_CHACN|nr:von Willebrand factor A domain-containing protein 7-like [Chanos chanos]